MFKIFYADEYGEVHFSKEEFESILNEVYNAGYHDGAKSKPDIWTSPIRWNYYNKPYCTNADSTLKSTGYDIGNNKINITCDTK